MLLERVEKVFDQFKFDNRTGQVAMIAHLEVWAKIFNEARRRLSTSMKEENTKIKSTATLKQQLHVLKLFLLLLRYVGGTAANNDEVTKLGKATDNVTNEVANFVVDYLDTLYNRDLTIALDKYSKALEQYSQAAKELDIPAMAKTINQPHSNFPKPKHTLYDPEFERIRVLHSRIVEML